MQQLIFSLIIIAAIGAGAYFLIKRNKADSAGSSAPPLPPPGVWQFQYSPNMPISMSGDSFDFPTQDGVHYLVKATGPLTVGQTITVQYSVTGSGQIVSVQVPSHQASVTLYIQRQGDNLSGAGVYQQYRYFGGPQKLSEGDWQITLPLTGDKWGDVFGQPGSDHPNEFAACLQNAAVVGLVFGSPEDGATGHGAYVLNGSAKFILKSFTVA